MLSLAEESAKALDAGDFVSSKDVNWLSQTPIPNDDLLRNVEANMRLGVPRIRRAEPHGDTFAFVGGGPSLASCLDNIRDRQRGDPTFRVFASGLTAKYLQESGITPWGYINIDPKPHMAEYVATASPECRFFIASCSDPAVFDVVAGRDVWMAHVPQGPIDMMLAQSEPETPFIAGGSTTPLRSVLLGYVLGFRRFEFFGVDSSFGSHAGDYAYAKKSLEPIFPVETEDGRRFLTTRILAGQADAFDVLVSELTTLDPTVVFAFHGDGLLTHLMSLGNEASPPA